MRVTPRIIAPMFSAAVDSNRSAPRPAQSPTLSPTRSAMTAGLRGSSSRRPASSLPPRSAPTSAELGSTPARRVRQAGTHDEQGDLGGRNRGQLAHQEIEPAAPEKRNRPHEQ